MFDGRAAAAAYGLTVEIADLGAWGSAILISEYDARAKTIRVNNRVLGTFAAGSGAEGVRQALMDFAIAHELYHHREAIGEVERYATRDAREAAADAFARCLVPAGVPLTLRKD